jgi:hypothetical protein
MTDPAFARFMIGLHQQIEEVDARTVLAEELSKRGVNPQLKRPLNRWDGRPKRKKAGRH